MILLDTCTLIWDAIEPSKLTSKARKAIEYSENGLMICDISIWEISMLIKKNRLREFDGIKSPILRRIFVSEQTISRGA